jgi:hypothetical protein
VERPQPRAGGQSRGDQQPGDRRSEGGTHAGSHRACGYDPSDAAVGGHAPIRWRNATILPR